MNEKRDFSLLAGLVFGCGFPGSRSSKPTSHVHRRDPLRRHRRRRPTRCEVSKGQKQQTATVGQNQSINSAKFSEYFCQKEAEVGTFLVRPSALVNNEDKCGWGSQTKSSLTSIRTCDYQKSFNYPSATHPSKKFPSDNRMMLVEFPTAQRFNLKLKIKTLPNIIILI